VFFYLTYVLSVKYIHLLSASQLMLNTGVFFYLTYVLSVKYIHLLSASQLMLNTGCFIIFSLITNIYDKKTEGPTLMELFTATVKLKMFFLTTRDVRCVHHGSHGTHRYDIQVLVTHAST